MFFFVNLLQEDATDLLNDPLHLNIINFSVPKRCPSLPIYNLKYSYYRTLSRLSRKSHKYDWKRF